MFLLCRYFVQNERLRDNGPHMNLYCAVIKIQNIKEITFFA